MKYAILKNGVIEYAPVNYKTSTGNLIVNFNKNETLMKKFGYKEVIDQKPSYNENTEYLVISGYTETENNIQINYTIKEMDMIEVETSIDNKIKSLENTDTEHELAIVEIVNLIIGGNE